MKMSQKERLSTILKQDKCLSPIKLLPALKSDIRDILREYGELAGDIALDIQDMQDGYNIMIVAKMSRFKSYGSVV